MQHHLKKRLYIFSLLTLSAGWVGAQNVGINKPNPTEALDVNGSINLNGTIKTNGAAGGVGQVLTSTGAGVAWSNMANEFKNVRQFYVTGSTPQTFSFTLPVEATRVMVEMWGGGGGGYAGTGGAAGNYLAVLRNIAPGTTTIMSITPGIRGLGGQNGFPIPSFNRFPTNGGTTTVSLAGSSFTVDGGNRGLSLPGEGFVPFYTAPPANFSTYVIPGQSGTDTETIGLYFPTNIANQFNELVKSGNGGSAFGFEGLAGIGSTYYKYTSGNSTSYIWLNSATSASGFGCGGGGGTANPDNYIASNGGPGLVVVRW